MCTRPKMDVNSSPTCLSFAPASRTRLHANIYRLKPILCLIYRPNNEILKHSTSIVGQQCLDKRGFVNVDQYLRLKGHKHIYCVGDVAAIREEKLGWLNVVLQLEFF